MLRSTRLARRLAGLALVASLGAAGLAGCDHTVTPDGPNLNDRFGPFTLVTPLAADRATVDFAAGQRVVFSARFNKQTAWVLEITGQTSGAVHRIEGVSNELNATNAVWTGRTTDLPLFRTETVRARLLLPNEDNVTPTETTLDVATPRVYEGNVIAAFEGGDRIAVLNPEFEFDNVGISAEVPPAQGEGFFLLRGTDDVVVNNFFIGLITIRPPSGTVFEVPTNIASELYFNCFLYGYGTANTIAVVEVVVDANGTGTYEEGRDRIVPLGTDVEFPNLGTVDFRGWRAYSEAASSFGAFGTGLTDAQTRQIVAVRVVLISDAPRQPTPPRQVEYGIDYLTFTAGRPLEL